MGSGFGLLLSLSLGLAQGDHTSVLRSSALLERFADPPWAKRAASGGVPQKPLMLTCMKFKVIMGTTPWKIVMYILLGYGYIGSLYYMLCPCFPAEHSGISLPADDFETICTAIVSHPHTHGARH